MLKTVATDPTLTQPSTPNTWSTLSSLERSLGKSSAAVSDEVFAQNLLSAVSHCCLVECSMTVRLTPAVYKILTGDDDEYPECARRPHARERSTHQVWAWFSGCGLLNHLTVYRSLNPCCQIKSSHFMNISPLVVEGHSPLSPTLL